MGFRRRIPPVPDSFPISLPMAPAETSGGCSSGGCSSGGGGCCGGGTAELHSDHDHGIAFDIGGLSASASDDVRRLPRWLKRNVPKGNANHFTDRLLEELRLTTVCEEAKCPNRMECWSQRTA